MTSVYTFGLFLSILWNTRAFEVTLLDTTQLDNLEWVTHSTGESNARRGWREASYSNEDGDVVRVYTVCNVAVRSVENWLRTPYINAQGAQRIYVDINFSMRKCTKFPDPSLLQQCKESIKLLAYEADSDIANAMMPTWDEETYRHIDVIAADRVFTDINQAIINQETRSIPLTKRGLYFAFYDQGSCATLLSVRVYYIICPSVTRNLAHFDNTTTGPELTSIVQGQGRCVSHALVDDSPPSYLCKSDGNWYFLTGSCKCVAGYQPSEKLTTCEACPTGSYKLKTNNKKCEICPPHSYTPGGGGASECQCDIGFYRAPSDHRGNPCTVPPSKVRGLYVTSKDHSSISLSWYEPDSLGGRLDLHYRIECLGCDDDVMYYPKQHGFNATRSTLRNLKPNTEYTIRIHAENGVSHYANSAATAEVLVNTDLLGPVKTGQVRITSVGTDHVTLVWQQNFEDTDLFEVRFWADDSEVEAISNFTTWPNMTFRALHQKTKYSFMVRSRSNGLWGEYSDVVHGTTGQISHYKADGAWTIIVGSAVAVMICMCAVLIMIAIFVKRDTRVCRKKTVGDCDMLQQSHVTIPLFSAAGSLKTYIDPHTYEDPCQAVREFTREIDASFITIEAVIGGGEFGDVCMGKLNLAGGGELIVAIKTLKSGASDKNRLDFLTEASIMGQFDDPNVIYLEGVVTKSHPVMIVTEFMMNGSLDSFLRKNDGQLSVPQLIEMIRGIASGMSYLSEMGYVHRDLAARNILVSETLVCKVADFGLSREIENDSKDGVYTTKGGKIPIRWTAPEAISYRKFTSSSDVWSYGVVMWEVMSFGERPYWNWSNQEVIKALDKDYRLTPPMDCPESVYQLMLDCWQKNRGNRPKFCEIVKTLDRLIRAPELLRKLAVVRSDSSQSLKSDTTSLDKSINLYDSVDHWLKDIKMERYTNCFSSAGYTSMERVARITLKDLNHLGINLVGHQKKILNSVQSMRSRHSSARSVTELVC